MEKAEKAIRDVFGDTSVSPRETIDRLEELRDLAQELIDAVQETMD